MRRIFLAGVSHDYRKRSLVYHLLTKFYGFVETSNPFSSNVWLIGNYSSERHLLFLKSVRKFVNPTVITHCYEARSPKIRADISIGFGFESLIQEESEYSELRSELPLALRWPLWADWCGSPDHDFYPPNRRLGKTVFWSDLIRAQPINNKSESFVAFWSHRSWPRNDLVYLLKKRSSVLIYGSASDRSIKNHDHSGFTKFDRSIGFAYAICPENTVSHGYITEKIPEAFVCGTVPITYCCQAGLKSDFPGFIGFNFYMDNNINAWLDEFEAKCPTEMPPLLSNFSMLDSFLRRFSLVVEKL